MRLSKLLWRLLQLTRTEAAAVAVEALSKRLRHAAIGVHCAIY
jgi:hypothetical protein